MSEYIHSAGTVQSVSATSQVLADVNGALTVPGGVQLDASNCYDGAHTGFEQLIRAGWLLAKNTTSGKYCTVKRTQANGAGSSATALVVDNAAAFKAGDAITVGGTAKVIGSVNYSTNTITITVAGTWSDNAVVIVSGMESAVAVLGEDVQLYDRDLLVATDATAGTVYRAGMLAASTLKGDVAAVTAVSGNLITKNFTLSTDLM